MANNEFIGFLTPQKVKQIIDDAIPYNSIKMTGTACEKTEPPFLFYRNGDLSMRVSRWKDIENGEKYSDCYSFYIFIKEELYPVWGTCYQTSEGEFVLFQPSSFNTNIYSKIASYWNQLYEVNRQKKLQGNDFNYGLLEGLLNEKLNQYKMKMKAVGMWEIEKNISKGD